MLKITVATKTESNITVSANSVVEFDPYFKTDRVKVITILNEGEENESEVISYKEQTSIIFKNKTWAKASDYQDGTTPAIGSEFKQYGDVFIIPLTDEQMAELEEGSGEFSNVFNGVQNIIIKAIEDGWGNYTGVGTGNVIYYKAVFS